jgi:hypothetical protein
MVANGKDTKSGREERRYTFAVKHRLPVVQPTTPKVRALLWDVEMSDILSNPLSP